MITFSQLGNPFWGRLGNQLFQIAGTIGIAKINNQEYIFPEWEYKHYFKNSLPFGVLDPCLKYRQKQFGYYPIILNQNNWDLEGFFQSEKFFINAEDTIRCLFQPNEDTDYYITQKYGALLEKETCSIHVRRGDYLKEKYSFPPQSIEYYNKAICLFDPETVCLIFSDDIGWCKTQFAGSRFVFIEGEKDIVDLFIMSRCRNHIISNSSFSWWGAWLNSSENKRVISPSHWFGYKVSSNIGKYTKDLYARGFERFPKNGSLFSYFVDRVSNVIAYGGFKLYEHCIEKSVSFVGKPVKRFLLRKIR